MFFLCIHKITYDKKKYGNMVVRKKKLYLYGSFYIGSNFMKFGV